MSDKEIWHNYEQLLTGCVYLPKNHTFVVYTTHDGNGNVMGMFLNDAVGKGVPRVFTPEQMKNREPFLKKHGKLNWEAIERGVEEMHEELEDDYMKG